MEISREEFKARLKPFRGEIKGIPTSSQLLPGRISCTPGRAGMIGRCWTIIAC
jgi:hypothetical protein